MIKDILLQLKDVAIRFGDVAVLGDVNMAIDEGEIVALLGANGAGKSSLLKSIFGLTRVAAGKVVLHGKAAQPQTHMMVANGIAYVPQSNNVFLHLTVRENLEVGGLRITDRDVTQQRVEELFAIYPMLKRKQNVKAKHLSGGQRQMLALARGLMTNPSLLLIDEPSAGLAPNLVSYTFKKIKEIQERHGTAILIVEHNISAVMSIADRAYILEKGTVKPVKSMHQAQSV
jgi:branched-chain amino acid transport system ATP-binding protein